MEEIKGLLMLMGKTAISQTNGTQDPDVEDQLTVRGMRMSLIVEFRIQISGFRRENLTPSEINRTIQGSVRNERKNPWGCT